MRPIISNANSQPELRIDELELTFLATGEAQHVFQKAGYDAGWVYKIPAAFGFVLPFDHEFQKFRCKTTFERILRFSLQTIPKRFSGRRRLSSLSLAGSGQGSLDKGRGECNESLLRSFGEYGIAKYCKWLNLKNFEDMLSIIGSLNHRLPANGLVPSQPYGRVTVRLQINGNQLTYSGPMLKQQRADHMFVRSDEFDTFAWEDIVASQQDFWRHGIGLVSAGEILGPKNWALVNGRMLLADTSALSKDFNAIRRSLDPAILDGREQIEMQQKGRRPEYRTRRSQAKEYFRYIRNEVNQEKLGRLWNQGNC